MPWIPLILLIGAAMSSGCAPDCGPAAQIAGNTYEVFTHPVSASGENLDRLTAPPDFSSYSVPVNGEGSWSFAFGNADVGPVAITIDGQSFDGQGVWDAVECGHFTVEDVGGEYAAADGSTHTFSAAMSIVVFGEQLEGLVQWNESWTLAGGETGTYRSTAQMRGVRVQGGQSASK